MKNNVIELKNYQSVFAENHSLTLGEVIDNLLLKAQKNLNFEPISKNAKGDDWDYDDGEFYVGEDGEVVMGYSLYSSEVFHEEGLEGNVEIEKEIFLTEEGGLRVVYTVTEYDYCRSCEKVHCRLHRIIAKDQSLSAEEAEAVLNQLSFELDEDPLFSE